MEYVCIGIFLDGVLWSQTAKIACVMEDFGLYLTIVPYQYYSYNRRRIASDFVFINLCVSCFCTY